MNLKNSNEPVKNSTEEKLETTADSLVIAERDDGSYTIDWDPNDPKWSWMNGLSEQQISEFIHDALKQTLDNKNV